MQLAVLAGGLGTRLRGAIPEGLPKPMAPIAGRPFLEHFLDRAISQGVDDIQLLVGHGADVIRHHFGNQYREIAVTYHHEEKPLGTGGALRAALPSLAREFIFANGDTFADVPYSRILELLDLRGPLSMSVCRIEDVGRYGSVITDKGEVVGFREKGLQGPGLVNAGVYGCHRDLADLLPACESFSFEIDFLEPKLPQLRPRFAITDSAIIDIGTPESLSHAETVFGR